MLSPLQPPAPWLSSEIKKEMLKRDSLLRLAAGTNVTSDWETYKIARNHVTGAIRDANSNYYKHVIIRILTTPVSYGKHSKQCFQKGFLYSFVHRLTG